MLSYTVIFIYYDTYKITLISKVSHRKLGNSNRSRHSSTASACWNTRIPRSRAIILFSPPIRIGLSRVRRIKIVVSFFENGRMPIGGPSLAPLIKSHPHRPRGLHKSGEVAPLTIRKKDRISEIAVNGTVQRPPASVFAPAKVKKTVKKYETLFPTPRPRCNLQFNEPLTVE